MCEVWKDIDFTNGKYQVSNFGNVRSVNYKQSNLTKNLSPIKRNTGYLYVVLYVNNKRKSYNIHRLVANAFIPKIDGKDIVNHKDENKLNNNVNNLEWCDVKYNTNYGSCPEKLSNSKKGILNPNFGKRINNKKVNQYDKDMNFVNSFDSIKEASIKNNINMSDICSCCNFRLKTAGKYIWRYSEV